MVCFGLCVFAPNRPQNSEGGMGMARDLAGRAESLHLCGAVLGVCGGMNAREPHGTIHMYIYTPLSVGPLSFGNYTASQDISAKSTSPEMQCLKSNAGHGTRSI